MPRIPSSVASVVASAGGIGNVRASAIAVSEAKA
jgi:hypothetical protein